MQSREYGDRLLTRIPSVTSGVPQPRQTSFADFLLGTHPSVLICAVHECNGKQPRAIWSRLNYLRPALDNFCRNHPKAYDRSLLRRHVVPRKLRSGINLSLKLLLIQGNLHENENPAEAGPVPTPLHPSGPEN